MGMATGMNMRMVDTTFGRYPLLPLREKGAEGRMRGRRRYLADADEPRAEPLTPDPSPARGEGRAPGPHA